MKVTPVLKIFLFAFLVFTTGLIASLFLGAVSGYDRVIFYTLRVPRTIAAIAVGGGLAVSGAIIQSVLANPLADPYTLGIASAGALGAVLGKAFQLPYGSAPLAFIFSLGALTLLTFWVRGHFYESRHILLVGVIAGFFFSSLATLILALSDPSAWTFSMGWILGSLSHIDAESSFLAFGANIIATIFLWFHWKALDLLAVDTELAAASGVDTASLRRRVFVAASFITAVCVSSAGIIGFIGLLVPHAFRLLSRGAVVSYRFLIPLSFLGGAGLLSFSDSVARILARPIEIPVGVVMALLGAPVFLLMARKARL